MLRTRMKQGGSQPSVNCLRGETQEPGHYMALCQVPQLGITTEASDQERGDWESLPSRVGMVQAVLQLNS